uniref:NADH-ubiquinone oxidoreductase chain 4 n=1 Tax=Phaenacantha marcida TaxID=498930 RepID=B7SMK0_9HEMI|nr:NADH dehydrogenase subunit 4 [Phaenacantha marcida]ABZ02094.1 NADH dehydrogenase subunit 4 [Phaenacantha marcida]
MMKYLFMTLFLIFIIKNLNLFMLLLLGGFLMLFINNINIYYSFISYNYGIDMVSYWMLLLTFWITFLMILASVNVSGKSLFMFLVYLLIIFLFLSFFTSNLFLFYLFFESSMIPTLLLIFGWGYQPERFSAGFYFIFYTLFASLPLLITIFYIYMVNGTLFFFLISLNSNFFIYLSLIMAFLIKMPMFFVHFWLPKAHVEAPVAGSMILAGVLLKLGGYGLYRVFYFLDYFKYNYVFICLSLFGSCVVGLLCLMQVDIKSMIAYSSVSHMGLVIGGIMTCNSLGLWGSLIMMLGHGLCSSGMFAMANIMYERTHSRMILINKGFLTFMPSMSMLMFIVMINNIPSPPTLSLLSEIILMMSLVSWSIICSPMLVLSSFLSCCYSIYLFSITQHGNNYSGMNLSNYNNIREYLLLIFHLIPLNFLFLKGEILSLWL